MVSLKTNHQFHGRLGFWVHTLIGVETETGLGY